MATVLASSNSAIPPISPITQPQFSTPPEPSTSSPPLPSIEVNQIESIPPLSSPPSPPSPPPNAPPPTTSETPVTSSPPPTNTPPPSQPPISPPPPPPSNPSPPPSPAVSSPPQAPPTDPPATSPPTTLPTPNPPTISSPSPPVAPPPQPSSSPIPPSLDPPENPPPPPPSRPPPSSEPPVESPPSSSPPIAPPKKSPPAPAVVTPTTSPPSSTNPPSEPGSSSSPSSVSHSSPPSSLVPPLRGPETIVQSSPTLPSQHSSSSRTATGSNGGISTGMAAVIGVVSAVLVLGLIGVLALWFLKRKRRKSGANDAYIIPASLGSSPRSDVKLVVKTDFPSPPFGGGSNCDTPSSHGGLGHSKPWFTYQELSEATSRFSDHNILGEGGFGYVCKGILADGRVVAVKQLKTGGSQGEREFQAEVEIISRIHHRHLVSLVGYCIWESKRLLVYEYVPNNTLYFHLHGEGRPTMDWATRLKIATGAARGIAYLHEDCHPRIIHRDIKSSNILLDNNFESRVADFGLARLAMDADTHISTRVMGTFGYLAPEYATSGKLTEKSDVYSFGVVLLELITGRKPVDESQPLGDESLVEWARSLLTRAFETGEFDGLVDPRLENNYIESEMFRMIEAAAACVRHSSTKRPRMGQVVRALDGISESGDLSNGLRVGESRMYDQQSAEIKWFARVAFGSQDISSEFFNQNLSNSFQGDISRQQSQSMGFSVQSRQNANL